MGKRIVRVSPNFMLAACSGEHWKGWKNTGDVIPEDSQVVSFSISTDAILLCVESCEWEGDNGEIEPRWENR